MKRVAVTGAGGRLGQFIVPHLKAKGSEIRSLSATCPDGLASSDFRSFLGGCQGLVHTAFSHVPGKYRGGEGDHPDVFWELNYDGLVRLVNQAREVGINRIILFSSRAVYGAEQFVHCHSIDESATAIPDTLYGKLKLATERLGQDYSDDPASVITLRPTGVYGGKAHTNKWTPMFQEAMRGILPKSNCSATEVSGQTVAEAVELALSDKGKSMGGQVFNLSDVRVSISEILGFAGFDVSSMPEVLPINGPELSSSKIKAFGLKFPGMDGIRNAASSLRIELTGK